MAPGTDGKHGNGITLSQPEDARGCRGSTRSYRDAHARVGYPDRRTGIAIEQRLQREKVIDPTAAAPEKDDVVDPAFRERGKGNLGIGIILVMRPFFHASGRVFPESGGIGKTVHVPDDEVGFDAESFARGKP